MKSSVGGIKGLFRSALEVLAGRAAVAIASLLFLAYFAREMPKELFGLMALHAAIAGCPINDPAALLLGAEQSLHLFSIR